jgi:transposase InsO family protein
MGVRLHNFKGITKGVGAPPLNSVECGKYYPAFQQLIDAAGVTRVLLPPRSPNLNAYAERWGRSVKEECLSQMILFGEASLRHALTQSAMR